jgi:signal transduction histidine kinase
MSNDLLEQLCAHATLGSAPRHELEWLVAHGTVQDYPEGGVLTHKGEQALALYIVLSGHVVIFVDRGNGPKKVMEWRGGDVTGVLPYSRMTSPPGDTVAYEPTTVLAVARESLRELTHECYVVTGILVHKMVDRARQFNVSDLHENRLASLGRLAAGLAHELNNPAAAIERSAALLDDRIDESERAALALGSARLTDAQLAAVLAIRESCLATPQQGVLSPIQQAERDEEIAGWLDDRGIDSRISTLLGETAATISALSQLAAVVDGQPLEAVLRWAAAGCSVRSISSEIQDAALRISGLVTSVKGFAHLDRGQSAEPVNLGTALHQTVAVYRSKARDKKVAVGVMFDESLPLVCGFVGELGQIFGNLLENALDAAPESGRVDIAGAIEHNRLVVRVIDNGSGVDPDLLVGDKLFDAFETKGKPVGKGTGLGLSIVRQLLRHNNGMIEVNSKPGRTEFSVSLPIANQPARSEA